MPAMLSSAIFHWRAADRSGLWPVAVAASFAAVLAGITGFAYADYAERKAAARRLTELICLAENVYFEARGELLAGQYAVAEVTMNRVASPLFPGTVCEVVREAHWDAARKRYVGAFSWTELDSLGTPRGYEWRRAMATASTVYDNYSEAPLVDGALFYHATSVTPAWARTKTRVARIGRHIFYE